MSTTQVNEQPVGAPAPSLWRRLARRLNAIFFLTVALPLALAVLYYGLIASDVFISESRFVVRSPQRTSPSGGIGALLAGVGISRSHDDTYTVHGYILSRDALAELEKKAAVREAYSNDRIDVFNRFPGMGWDRSFEALFDHYQKHVSIAYDPVAEITTLQVRAFSSQKAQELNELLLQMSERLVNNLNDRSRQDLIVVAQREVSEAEKQVRNTSLAVSAFRSKGNVYDPLKESETQVDTVARLKEELRVIDAQVARLKQVAPSNPQIATLNAQADQLKRDIKSETAKVIGENNSLASKTSTFERLMLDKGFAEKQLESALASLQAARDDAARKQLYLERLVQPNLPDTALEPQRLRGILTVLIIGLIAWGVVSLLVAGVREHMD
jgi:capsular polysaccharide transport system permease protein